MVSGGRPQIGEIYLHTDFYERNGRWLNKYLLVFGVTPADNVLFALLTSQDYGRHRAPPCDNGPQAHYPGYYLGVLGGALQKDSWIDLRELVEIDALDWQARSGDGVLLRETALDSGTLRPAIECTASAEDAATTRQEKFLRDVLSQLP